MSIDAIEDNDDDLLQNKCSSSIMAWSESFEGGVSNLLCRSRIRAGAIPSYGIRTKNTDRSRSISGIGTPNNKREISPLSIDRGLIMEQRRAPKYNEISPLSQEGDLITND